MQAIKASILGFALFKVGLPVFFKPKQKMNLRLIESHSQTVFIPLFKKLYTR